MARPQKSVKEKVQKEMPEFASEIDSSSVAQLEARLSGLAKAFEETDEAQKADEELSSTQTLVSELKGPYTDAKKAIRLKTKYVISAIRDKGGNV